LIFSVFVFLFILALVFIGLGYAVDIPVFSLVGAIFIIGLGVVILGSNVEVRTGQEDIYIYGNNFDGYHWEGYNITAPSQTDKEAFLFHQNITYTYEPYDFGGIGNTTFGILTLILGMSLFVIIVMTAGDD